MTDSSLLSSTIAWGENEMYIYVRLFTPVYTRFTTRVFANSTAKGYEKFATHALLLFYFRHIADKNGLCITILFVGHKLVRYSCARMHTVAKHS